MDSTFGKIIKIFSKLFIVAVVLTVIYPGVDFAFKSVLSPISRAVLSNFILFALIIGLVMKQVVHPQAMLEVEQTTIENQIKESLKLKSEAIKLGFLPIGQRKVPKVKCEKGGLVVIEYDEKNPQEYVEDSNILDKITMQRLQYFHTIYYRKELSYKVKKAGEVAFNNLPIGIVIINNKRKILWSNNEAKEILENIDVLVDGPFILDGYPRNIKQAIILDDVLNIKKPKITLRLFYFAF